MKQFNLLFNRGADYYKQPNLSNLEREGQFGAGG